MEPRAGIEPATSSLLDLLMQSIRGCRSTTELSRHNREVNGGKPKKISTRQVVVDMK